MSNELDVLKNSVVTEMFVDTADQNYVIARWAYHRRMFIDFFWNAVHALEKYFKASLLLNNQSAKDYTHDLTRLFTKVSSYAGDLFPDRLIQPPQLNLNQLDWREETPTAFLARFNKLGDPNNRYNVFGYVQRWEDLHHLDQMVYFSRRVARDLEAWPFIGHRQISATAPKTYRELSRRFEKYSPRTGRLYELLGTRGDDELRDAGLKLNFQFAPEDYNHDGVGMVTSSTRVLRQRIIVRVESMTPSWEDQEAADLVNWMLQNISLPEDVKNELQAHAQKLWKRAKTIRGRHSPI